MVHIYKPYISLKCDTAQCIPCVASSQKCTGVFCGAYTLTGDFTLIMLKPTVYRHIVYVLQVLSKEELQLYKSIQDMLPHRCSMAKLTQ